MAFLAWTFAVYDYISVGTLLPKIADSFHWSTSFATGVATYVSIGTFVAAMLVGPLLDYLGRKKAMLVTTIGAAVSSGFSALDGCEGADLCLNDREPWAELGVVAERCRRHGASVSLATGTLRRPRLA